MLTTMTTSAGHRLAYRRFGNGPMIVAHPGGPGFSGTVFGDLGGLAEHFEFVLVDPRGTGGSERPDDGRYELDGYVSDLVDLLADLDARPSMLLGHSHGGLVALMFASEHPDEIDHLVLVGTPSHVDASLIDVVENSRDVIIAVESTLGAEAPPSVREVGGDAIESWGAAGHQYEPALTEEGIQTEPLEYFNDHVIDDFDLRSVLSSVTTPTLVVCGRDDEVAGPEASRVLVSALPSARLSTIEGSGHVPFIENAPAFRDAVLAYARASGLVDGPA